MSESDYSSGPPPGIFAGGGAAARRQPRRFRRGPAAPVSESGGHSDAAAESGVPASAPRPPAVASAPRPPSSPRRPLASPRPSPRSLRPRRCAPPRPAAVPTSSSSRTWRPGCSSRRAPRAARVAAPVPRTDLTRLSSFSSATAKGGRTPSTAVHLPHRHPAPHRLVLTRRRGPADQDGLGVPGRVPGKHQPASRRRVPRPDHRHRRRRRRHRCCLHQRDDSEEGQ
ncbi:hypothetical protein M885DRAFT_144114 [Pelagophyceae sp. CCMP2097]|nr:hypothetical protein M885DRAFT_144114 [Pelagophyceae sp. CCMP2097]